MLCPKNLVAGNIREASEVRREVRHFKIFRTVILQWEVLPFAGRGHWAVLGDFFGCSN